MQLLAAPKRLAPMMDALLVRAALREAEMADQRFEDACMELLRPDVVNNPERFDEASEVMFKACAERDEAQHVLERIMSES